MLRKLTAITLLVSLVLTMTPQAWAAATTPLEKLAEIEVSLYGAPQVPGALLQRLDNVESTLFGKPTYTKYPIVARIDKLATLVSRSDISGASLLLKLNVVEWLTFRETQSMSTPLFERLNDMEEVFHGDVRLDGGVIDRVNELVSLVWAGELNISKTPVLPGTEVKVKLLTELSSTTSQPGDVVRYQVIEDVAMEEQLIIPTGAEGKGTVQEVKKSGGFGQEGQVGIDFGTVKAIDGTPLKMMFSAPVGGSVGQAELAAGASLGGMVLLGPLGLAAGYFVQGKEQVIPVGAEFILKVKDKDTVQAFSMLPAD